MRRKFGVETPRAKWEAAHDEHAALLRLEGLTYLEVGARMGVGREQARQRALRAGQRWQRAMRRCKLTFVKDKI